jgi:hypothetical protein
LWSQWNVTCYFGKLFWSSKVFCNRFLRWYWIMTKLD